MTYDPTADNALDESGWEEPAPNKAQHSPLPWRSNKEWIMQDESAGIHGLLALCFDRGSAPVGDSRVPSRAVREANAKLIVASVNHADKLAEALRELLDYDPPRKAAERAEAALAAYESEAAQ